MARQPKDARPLVIHVKTALREDDAQICVAPNVAWAALDKGRPVTIVFDGSAVQSIAKGYGWRGWIGAENTAMEWASLPERERQALADQFGVPLDEVPPDYGAYVRFLKERGVKLYYNRTMILPYDIEPDQMDGTVEPLDLKRFLDVLDTDGQYLVY